MSEYLNQIEAAKARRQRFAMAAAKYSSKQIAEADDKLVVPLHRVLQPDEIKPVRAEKSWEEQQKDQWFSIVSEISHPKVEDIIREVCVHFAVAKVDLLSARRTHRLTRPRQVGYYVSKVLTKRSLKEIARRFGNRDHTSALHGVRKIEHLRKTDEQLNSSIREIVFSLGGQLD